MAGILPDIGEILRSYFHPERGYEGAEDQLRKFYDEARGRAKPYLETGEAQVGPLTTAEKELLDPQTLLNKWIQGYSTSPYAQQLQREAQSTGLSGASAQGLLGSSSALQNIEQTGTDIMQKDRENYLRNLMEKYMTGINLGQNLYGVGANMTGAMNTLGQRTGENIAGTTYGRLTAPGNILTNLIQMYINSMNRTGQGLQQGVQAAATGGAGGAGAAGIAA